MSIFSNFFHVKEAPILSMLGFGGGGTGTTLGGAGGGGIQASGGDQNGIEPGNGYKYHTFTTTGAGTFTVTEAPATAQIEFLMVAGGGTGVSGGGGADTLTGGVGVDTLNGGAGLDNIDAGAGNDIISITTYTDFQTTGGTETVDGGAGTDTLSLAEAAAPTITAPELSTVSNIEVIDATSTIVRLSFHITVIFKMFYTSLEYLGPTQ